MPTAIAQPQYGNTVDDTCNAFNGTTPYASDGCDLCHSSSYGQRIDPAWTHWFNNDLTQFCGSVPSNQAPNGNIISPGSNQTIAIGGSIFFQANASDPDNNFPLSYRWDFASAAPASIQQIPGNITFTQAGTYVVQFFVTDNLGMTDPTPAQRIITVVDNNPNLCTDNDNDGYSTQGGACGLVDCNDNAPNINPGAVEACGDNIDNNCNGLTDSADPVATNCNLTCIDNDGDDFSPQGGICGPIDCNDANPNINPGTNENCGDGIDNDCDGATDNSDKECNAGGDCVGSLVHAQVLITKANWDPNSLNIHIEGTYHQQGEYVLVTATNNNSLLGVTVVNNQNIWALTIRQPYIIPCRIKVSIAGNTAEIDVLNAPSSCDSIQTPNNNDQDSDNDDNNQDDDNSGDDDNSEDQRNESDDDDNEEDQKNEGDDDDNEEDNRNENDDDNDEDQRNNNEDVTENRGEDNEEQSEESENRNTRDRENKNERDSSRVIIADNANNEDRNSEDSENRRSGNRDDDEKEDDDKDENDNERREFTRGIVIGTNDNPENNPTPSSGSLSFWFLFFIIGYLFSQKHRLVFFSHKKE